MDANEIGRVLRQGIRLRCPRCGRAPLFRGWFAMYDHCRACGLVFEREQGYFVGAIYVNYAFTVAICIGGFLALERLARLTLTTQILIWSAVGVVFPLLFFRHSRSLWLSLDYVFNPEPADTRGAR